MLLDRIFEVDSQGVFYDEDGDESEDVMDLDNSYVRDYIGMRDYNENALVGERLLDQRLRAEELDIGFYEDLDQRLQDLEDLEKAEEELAQIDIDAIIAEEAKGG